MNDERPEVVVLMWVLMIALGLGIGAVATDCGSAKAGNPKSRLALATSYTHMSGPNAKWNGHVFRCGKSSAGRWGDWDRRRYKRVTMNGGEFCVAHRSIKCGAVLRISHVGRDGIRRAAVAQVCDRGPYWAVPVECAGLMLKRWSRAAQKCWSRGGPRVRLRDRSHMWPTDLDVTRLVGIRLRLGGRGIVRYEVVR